MKFGKIALMALGFSAALMTGHSIAAGRAPYATAVINPDGSVARGFHVADTTERLDKGIYEVDFDRKVVNCAYTAAIGISGSNGSSDPGAVVVATRSGTDNGLYVQTFNKSAHLANLGFHLIVVC